MSKDSVILHHDWLGRLKKIGFLCIHIYVIDGLVLYNKDVLSHDKAQLNFYLFKGLLDGNVFTPVLERQSTDVYKDGQIKVTGTRL